MNALVDVVGFELQEVDGVRLECFEGLEVLVEREVGLAYQSVPLDLAHDEVSNLVVYDPVLLLINVVLLPHLLLDVLVQLCEVYYVVVHY